MLGKSVVTRNRPLVLEQGLLLPSLRIKNVPEVERDHRVGIVHVNCDAVKTFGLRQISGHLHRPSSLEVLVHRRVWLVEGSTTCDAVRSLT